MPKKEKPSPVGFNARLTAVGILALIAVILVLRNTRSVETDLIFTSISMPHALLLTVTLLVGFLLGLLVSARRGPLIRVRRKRTRTAEPGAAAAEADLPDASGDASHESHEPETS